MPNEIFKSQFSYFQSLKIALISLTRFFNLFFGLSFSVSQFNFGEQATQIQLYVKTTLILTIIIAW